MEVLGILLGVGLLLGIPLLGLIGFLRTLTLSRRVAALEAALAKAAPAVPTPIEPAVVVAPAPRQEPPPSVQQPPEPVFAQPVAAEPVAATPAVVRPDVATNLGPKIMAGVAALFVVTALAFFVKYAWDNNWVGPAGRVLGSALFSLIVFAIGATALRRQYRPVGQALMATGLAGLYVVAFAAHGVYGLIPRGAAFALMVAVTAAAVLLSVRLEARLLSVLAWVGAYLAPVLVSSGEDRAEALFGYLALLALGALAVDRRRAWPETALIAQIGTWLLYGGWFVTYAARGRFGVAAFGLLLFTALFALGPRPGNTASTLLALLVGSAWLLGAGAQSPLIVGQALLGLGVVGALATERFGFALLITQALAWATIGVGGAEHDRATSVVVTLAIAIFVYYLAVLVIRGRSLGPARRPLSGALGGHVLNAVAFWLVLFTQLYPAQLWPLTGATVALAALYLALGRMAPAQSLSARTLLGLGAMFLTVAIPVRLGLNGITIAWAAEGVLLLWLGQRSQSLLARLGGYAVLGLAVGRLFGRHLPMHGDEWFRPVVNPSFGVWLFVALALFAAYRVARSVGDIAERRLARWLCAGVAVAVLFIGATVETSAVFAAQERAASNAHDYAAAERADLLGGLAISLLWSGFASALLVAGLSLRSRAVFYAAYGLFAVAAAKVVLVDLATLQTLYRILSFLALGVLLMVGAFLILKFRHRLEPPATPETTP